MRTRNLNSFLAVFTTQRTLKTNHWSPINRPTIKHPTITAVGQALHATIAKNSMRDTALVSINSDGRRADRAKKK
jgi:hypothetical protein